jgi:hypothetical protein
MAPVPAANGNPGEMPHGVIVLTVKRRDMMRCDISPITTEIDGLIARQSRGGALMHKIYLEFQGFEGDDRYPREIPEVREWFRRLEQRYPFLLYLLSSHRNQIREFAAMFVPYNMEGRELVFEREPLERYLKEKLSKSVSYARAIGVDPRVSVMKIIDQLAPGHPLPPNL